MAMSWTFGEPSGEVDTGPQIEEHSRDLLSRAFLLMFFMVFLSIFFG